MVYEEEFSHAKPDINDKENFWHNGVCETDIPNDVVNKLKSVRQIKASNFETDEMVVICEVFSPSFFWIRQAQLSEQFQNFMNNLAQFYDENDFIYSVPPNALKKGLHVACKYDKIWHRGIVKTVCPKDRAYIFFYDYGSIQLKSLSQLYFLHRKFSHVPALAIPCALYGVQPCQDKRWPKLVIEEFVTMVLDKTFQLNALMLKNSINAAVVQLLLPDQTYLHKLLISKNMAKQSSEILWVDIRNYYFEIDPRCFRHAKPGKKRTAMSRFMVSELRNRERQGSESSESEKQKSSLNSTGNPQRNARSRVKKQVESEIKKSSSRRKLDLHDELGGLRKMMDSSKDEVLVEETAKSWRPTWGQKKLIEELSSRDFTPSEIMANERLRKLRRNRKSESPEKGLRQVTKNYLKNCLRQLSSEGEDELYQVDSDDLTSECNSEVEEIANFGIPMANMIVPVKTTVFENGNCRADQKDMDFSLEPANVSDSETNRSDDRNHLEITPNSIPTDSESLGSDVEIRSNYSPEIKPANVSYDEDSEQRKSNKDHFSYPLETKLDEIPTDSESLGSDVEIRSDYSPEKEPANVSHNTDSEPFRSDNNHFNYPLGTKPNIPTNDLDSNESHEKIHTNYSLEIDTESDSHNADSESFSYNKDHFSYSLNYPPEIEPETVSSQSDLDSGGWDLVGDPTQFFPGNPFIEFLNQMSERNQDSVTITELNEEQNGEQNEEDVNNVTQNNEEVNGENDISDMSEVNKAECQKAMESFRQTLEIDKNWEPIGKSKSLFSLIKKARAV